MSNLNSDRSRKPALKYLRELQQIGFNTAGIKPAILNPDTTEQTLQFLLEQTRYESTDDPDRVRRGGFSYHRELEDKRIILAENLIRRADPGPYEDSNYLALLAFQAASLELVLSDLIGEKQAQERPLKFILGTLHNPELNAFSQITPIGDFTIVAYYSGLIDFVYQAAKAVVEAMNPAWTEDGKVRVHSTTDLDKISAGLEKNRAPIDRMWKTLEAGFFRGYPRYYVGEEIKQEYLMPLSILVRMAERWVIAHEYGHALLKPRFADMNGSSEAGFGKVSPENPNWDEEFAADNSATILTIFSASKLDGLPPEFALSGGIFSLNCSNILQKSLSVLCTGEESIDEGCETHPPIKARMDNMVNCFIQFFDFEYVQGGPTWNLSYVRREEPRVDQPYSSKYLDLFYFNANVLNRIWVHIKPILENQYQAQRPLHRMWLNSCSELRR